MSSIRRPWCQGRARDVSSALLPASAGKPEQQLPSTSGFGIPTLKSIGKISATLSLLGSAQLAVDTTLVPVDVCRKPLPVAMLGPHLHWHATLRISFNLTTLKISFALTSVSLHMLARCIRARWAAAALKLPLLSNCSASWTQPLLSFAAARIAASQPAHQISTAKHRCSATSGQILADSFFEPQIASRRMPK